MDAYISKGKAFGTVTVPPSKSLTHRGLICGALVGVNKEKTRPSFANKAIETQTVISPIYNSTDIITTIECLRKLGAIITIEGDRAIVESGISPSAEGCILDCRESGSTLRFLLPICLAMGIPTTFRGSRRLFQRPMDVYEGICRKQGITYKIEDESITVEGRMEGGCITVQADISSQFISGLLFALPLLKVPSKLVLSTRAESWPYVLLTINIMKEFGINVSDNWDHNMITIDENQCYHSPGSLYIEGDYSSAVFLDSLNYLGGKVSLQGLNKDSTQGDKVYKQYFEAISKGNPVLDISDCPDLGPILMVMGAVNNGVTLTGTRRLNYKESNRGCAMADELRKFGTNVYLDNDRIVVERSKISSPKEAICTHNDHRIAMALSVLCTLTGGIIKDCGVVAKSFPDFYENLGTLGIKICFKG